MNIRAADVINAIEYKAVGRSLVLHHERRMKNIAIHVVIVEMTSITTGSIKAIFSHSIFLIENPPDINCVRRSVARPNRAHVVGGGEFV